MKLLPLIWDTLMTNIILADNRKQRIPSDQYPLCQINGVHILTLHNSQIDLIIILPLILRLPNALVLRGFLLQIFNHVSYFWSHLRSQKSSKEAQNVIPIHFYFKLLHTVYFQSSYMFRLCAVAFIRELQYYKYMSCVSSNLSVNDEHVYISIINVNWCKILLKLLGLK